jgi:cytochrome bd-type quinol oxidase subunit 2
VLLNTIGPVWDGNEVWLLTAGGATFAAFPEWYATLFSGFYLALALILVALMVGWAGAILAAVSLLAGLFAAMKGREGWAFIGTFATIAFAVVSYFGALYPNAMPSTLGAANDLTLAAASSTPKTLTIMTWAAVVFTPIVLIYTAWTYWVFRKRIAPHHIPAEEPQAVGTHR